MNSLINTLSSQAGLNRIVFALEWTLVGGLASYSASASGTSTAVLVLLLVLLCLFVISFVMRLKATGSIVKVLVEDQGRASIIFSLAWVAALLALWFGDADTKAIIGEWSLFVLVLGLALKKD